MPRSTSRIRRIVGFCDFHSLNDHRLTIAIRKRSVHLIDAQVMQAVEQVGGIYLDIEQPLASHPELMQVDDVHPAAHGHL